MYAIEIKSKRNINGNRKRVYVIRDEQNTQLAVIRCDDGLVHAKSLYANVWVVESIEATPITFSEYNLRAQILAVR